MNTNQIIGLVIAAIVIIAGAYYLITPKSTPTTTTSTDQTMTGDNMTGSMGTNTTTTTSTTTTPAPGTPVTITYTNAGFTPSNLKISKGTVVTFVNQSTEQMEVASDPHPSHTAYDTTSRSQHCTATGPTSTKVFDECVGVAAGSSWSFTFDKLGSWGFHNHLNPNKVGSVTVFAPVAATTTTTVQVKVNAQ